ncbi:type I-E CRISPR-associated protein Cse1/CasA [Streptomyces sp. NPDC088745]|uniref:type I-E CRISPR-associated protein Cse1/CasA n=1 Tax=Streptomyces sp. NPDC088745 TaxID=3365884 RepID=UPI00380195B4
MLSFDLTARPWLPVLRLDGTSDELSLREVLAQADELHKLAGDLPTQEFALLRLLLAVCHDALDGPTDSEEWGELWADRDCFAKVPAYLDAHRERFDLLHPQAPFFQVAGLRTAKDEVSSLNRIVADVPNGDPFFSSRRPTVDRLGFAEAARWLVHAHAYDTSGIKTGAVDDERVKGGKVYPQGVGWAGALGGVYAEGRTLRETLLLNLVAADTSGLHFGDDDRPAWRRAPCGPGAGGDRRPSGVRDLYTWQSRRVRLHYDADSVHGVVLGYGDPLPAHNMHTHETMTAWRRSPAQEKKRKEAVVYLPREHDPARAAWRGLESLIAGKAEGVQTSEAARYLRPGIFEWIAQLVTGGELERGFLIRAHVVGAAYGTQQSVIDEVVDDRVAMAVVLLHRQDREYGQQAIDAVHEADEAVKALGDLASDLARAVGADHEGSRAAARDRGFAALDAPYRTWLSHLAKAEDLDAQRRYWQQDVHRIIARVGEGLLCDTGDAAWEGRIVTGPKGAEWRNSAHADKWFRLRLDKCLSNPFRRTPDTDGTADTRPAAEGAPMTTRATGFTHARKRVGEVTAELIRPLQSGYLRDDSVSVGARARLSRGAGKTFGQVIDLLGLVDTSALYDAPAGGGHALREADLSAAEDAVHTALTLWALHQQSRGSGMHRRDSSRGSRAGLGAAVRRLMKPGEVDQTILKRLVRAGSAPDTEALSVRLREIVLLLREAEVPLDYGLLAGQLFQWQQPGGRDLVRREWGRSFQSAPTPENDETTGPDAQTGSGDDDILASNDKDAS